MTYVKQLHRLGLVNFTCTPKCRATVFLVEGKNKTLRMIADARLANQMFRDPPSASLASPETFASLEVSDDVDLDEATADVENCFHRMGISPGLGEYFLVSRRSRRV